MEDLDQREEWTTMWAGREKKNLQKACKSASAASVCALWTRTQSLFSFLFQRSEPAKMDTSEDRAPLVANAPHYTSSPAWVNGLGREVTGGAPNQNEFVQWKRALYLDHQCSEKEMFSHVFRKIFKGAYLVFYSHKRSRVSFSVWHKTSLISAGRSVKTTDIAFSPCREQPHRVYRSGIEELCWNDGPALWRIC